MTRPSMRTVGFSLTAPFMFAMALAPLASAQPAPPQGPPREAIRACSGRSQGQSCSFTSPRGDQIDGTCRAPEGRELACAPARPHGPPPGAMEACAGIDEGDACVVDTPRGTLEGRCIATPDGTMCMPPHPPRGE